MTRQPERTCIGCRGSFRKDQVVRLVAGAGELVVDYREKLPGRAAYVCPRRECIEQALSRDALKRALKTNVKPPDPEAFINQLVLHVESRVRSLIAMSAKAGRLAAGYSAVHDALEKNRVELLLYAGDLSDGTREKLTRHRTDPVREASLFTCGELGRLLSRELIGVVAFLDKGLADAAWNESERLKSLINRGR